MALGTPRFISVDDHILEPGDLWQRYLPQRFQHRAPRLARLKGRFDGGPRGAWVEDEAGLWANIWVFEGLQMPIIPGFAAAGMDQNYLGEHWDATTYESMRPGCYQQTPRLADMDANHTEAALSFPTFPRFCGSAVRPSSSGASVTSPSHACRPTTTG